MGIRDFPLLILWVSLTVIECNNSKESEYTKTSLMDKTICYDCSRGSRERIPCKIALEHCDIVNDPASTIQEQCEAICNSIIGSDVQNTSLKCHIDFVEQDSGFSNCYEVKYLPCEACAELE